MHESLVHALYDKLNWVNFVLPFEIKSVVSNMLNQLKGTRMSLCGLLQVKIQFADTQRQPGEKTRLIIKAAQGSKVAITAVDRSVHLLEEGNELSEADVSLYWMKAAIVKGWESQFLKAQNAHVEFIQL